MVTQTHGRLHFEDLDPMRFEDLCLSIVYRMRRWNKIDHLGRVGTDSGIDIRAYEMLENGKENVHHFQCKRYSKITKAQLKSIVDEYCLKNNDRPDYYYLIIGCDIRKEHVDYIREYSSKNGIRDVIIWSASILESVLYDNYHDLLFAFFGVNMTDKRNTRISSIRRNVALKKRMRADFLKSGAGITQNERMKRMRDPSLKFNHSEVLVRSIYDTDYPDNNINSRGNGGFFKAEVFDFYHNGLMVRCAPYRIDAVVRIDSGNEVDTEEISLETIGCIPYESIIEYDYEGDQYYNFPHLYCDYICGADPFDEIRYRSANGYWVKQEEILEIKKK